MPVPIRRLLGASRVRVALIALALVACQADRVTGPSATDPHDVGRTSTGPVSTHISSAFPTPLATTSTGPVAGALGSRTPGGSALRDAIAAVSSTASTGDTSPRIVWTNASTGERSLWLMNGTSYSGSAVSLPTVPTEWQIAGSADFSGDGQADLVWQNTRTGDRSLWVMDGNGYSGTAADLPYVSNDWQIAATADFNGDGKPDIVWQNLTTGDRSIWLMNGTAYSGTHAELPYVSPEWRIVSTADFNADGKPDIVWQNVQTGDRSIWLMDGYAYSGTHSELPWVPVEWSMVSTADFNGDGKPDILWQNTTTGERSIWIMDGITYTGTHADLPTVPPEWQMSTTMPKLYAQPLARAARVIIAPDSASIVLGNTAQLTAVVRGEAGDTLRGRAVVWTALDTAIATVGSSGLVTGRSIGWARIVATADNGPADTAIVTIRSPVSRVVVSPDPATLTAVGQTRAYTAVAYDTAGVAMTGTVFTWRTANPLVATLDVASGTGAVATAHGSGVTAISAESFGVSGSATLTVGQSTARIDASPDTVVLAVGGKTTLSATVYDGNGQPMPDASPRWRAINSYVTVDSMTGLVQAVSLGTAKVVARLNGVTSDSVVVIVSNSAAPGLAFAARSFTVGRFAQLSVPIYLSRTPTAPVVLFLTSRDTSKGKFSSARVVFNAGQTESNVSLSALNVGTLRIVAQDSAGTFGKDSATVQVAITATLTVPGARYGPVGPSTHVGDQLTAELRLSDPAPSGGLYFTTSGGTSVSTVPQTVLVPAGQLATSFTVNAVAAGSSVITAQAAGTTTASSLLQVVPAHFNFSDGSGAKTRFTIGLGQLNDSVNYGPVAIWAPLNPVTPLHIGMRYGTAGVIAGSDSVIMPTSWNRAGIPFRATALGTTTIAGSANGWTSDVDTIIVTRPKVQISNLSYLSYGGIFSNSGRGSVYATLVDSTGRSHPAADTVHFTFRSGDSTVMQVENGSQVVRPGEVMPPGQYMYMNVRGGGSTWIYTSAPGYITDSMRITVQVPQLAFSRARTVIAAGYVSAQNTTVTVPTAPSVPLVVKYTSSDTMVAAADSSVLQYTPNIYLRLRSRRTGTATLIASAPGYSPDTLVVSSQQGRLQATFPQTIAAFASATLSGSAFDSVGTYISALDTMSVRFTVRDTSILQMDSTVLHYAVGQQLSNALQLVGKNVGKTQVVVSAPGLRSDSTLMTVTGAPLAFSGYSTANLGTSQRSTSSGLTVMLPTARSVPVVVHLSRRSTALVSELPDSVVIPAGQTQVTTQWGSGTVTGVDTIVSSATGYVSARWAVSVLSPKLIPGGFYTGNLRPTMPPQQVSVAVGMLGDANPRGVTTRPLTIYVTSSNSAVLVSDSTAIHVLPGDQYRYFPARAVGPGTARLIFRDSAGGYLADSTNLATVVAPQISFTNAYNYLGMRQQTPDSGYAGNGGVQVTVDDDVRGAPLTITLNSSDPRVVTAPATVTIPVGRHTAWIRLTGMDTTGSIAVYGTANGFLQGRLDMNVAKPKFVATVTNVSGVPADSTSRGYLDLRTAVPSTNGYYENATTENLTVSVTSSDPTILSVDSPTVVIPAGQRSINTPIFRARRSGTVTITVTDPRTGFVSYVPASVGVTVQ